MEKRWQFSRRTTEPRSPAAVEEFGEGENEARQDITAVERLVRAN
jgi:hypothetical protein